MKRIAFLFGVLLAGLPLLFGAAAMQMLLAIAPADPLAPTVLWVKFNEGTGSTASASPGTALTFFGTPAWVSNGSGYAASTPGDTSTYLESASAQAVPHASVTITGWFNIASSSGFNRYMLGLADGSGSKCDLYLNSGQLIATLPGTGGTALTKTYNVPTLSTWHFFGFFVDRDAATFRVFVDGSEITATSTTQNDRSGETGNFPDCSFSTGYRLQAYVDDVRIYAGDRTGDLAAIYAAGPQ